MKRILVTMMAGLVLAASVPVMAQKHRHTPVTTVKVNSQTDDNGNTKNATAVVAFSDTTSVDSTDTDSIYDAGTYGWDKPYDIGALADLMHSAFMPVAIVFIMFFLAPVIIIGLIIYFVLKSRKQKIQLAELALKNGQPIPQEVVKPKVTKNEDLWAKGLKKVFFGAGLVVFSLFIDSSFFTGFGFALAFYGVGQAVIAWTTKKKIAPDYMVKDENSQNDSGNAVDSGSVKANGEGKGTEPSADNSQL
ncbi:DUF6249 domain-containing protein [uncultured Prevotella sp.]|uniref:DUF6249 domain-containing protein n=1 Tax=uncultured Prevotella sp. TaxID=159272 RepID=UPI002631AC0F|nr:DUF6249 domain-containing protein [uncultured Prevotella sp.]